MRSRCEPFRDLLEARWDGEASGSAQDEALREHLQSCMTCAALAGEMEGVLRAAASLREARYDRPVAVAPLVLRPAARTWAWGLAGGVAFAFVLAAGFFWSVRVSQQAGPVSPPQMVVRLAVPLADAQSVSVMGDFTGWDRAIPLARTDDGLWVGELRVPAGRYRYVIVVDEKHIQPDPAAPQVVDDGFGGKNSVLDVGGSI